MIEINKLEKLYLSARKMALYDVNLKIPRGQIIGLFGENGAGKTTLMKCILKLLKYDGNITLDGKPITKRNIEKLSFATCEHSFFPNLTPYEHLEFYKEHFPRFREKRFHVLMEFFELWMHTPLHNFSVGQKNQFEVILALCQGADYILMDEPFAGNDLFNREDFYKVLIGILEPNETVLISTHLIEEVADFIGRAILIRKGRIVGDVLVSDLEEEGTNLIDYIKETYNYRKERVMKAIHALSEEESE